MPQNGTMLDGARAHPGRVLLVALVAFLVLATVLDLPSRLSGATVGPPDARPTAATTASPTPSVLAPATGAGNARLSRCVPSRAALSSCGKAPALGPGDWTNTVRTPRMADLRGQVVLVDFFSGSCVACRRDLRYVRAWDASYRASGLQVIGVHSPAFAFEKEPGTAAGVARSLQLRHPVLADDSLATATAYRDRDRPAKYLVDATGTVRAISSGEGGYRRLEKQIRTLLRDARPSVSLPAPVGLLTDAQAPTPGIPAQIDLGDARGASYDAEIDSVAGHRRRYSLASAQPEGTAGLGGTWTVGPEIATSGRGAQSRVTARARTVYQVIGGTGTVVVAGPDGAQKPIRVSGPPHLQEVYSSATAGPRTLLVRYSPGLQVYAFSFG